MRKQKFYSIDNLLKENAEYNILLGERSNGKSYAVKEYCLSEAYKKGHKFVLLRRWQIETKATNIEAYFADAPIRAITDGKCNAVTVYRGDIFASHIEEDGTITKIKQLGKVLYLTGETHYKSMSFPEYCNVIYEEFITTDGYLPNEPTKLFSLVSTIARRRKISVFMIGNTMSRMCPYFTEWQLTNIPKQEQGTIDNYYMPTDQVDENGNNIVVKISVEFCENSGNNSKMFFGQSSKMITSGAWECVKKLHLDCKYNECKKIYSVTLQDNGFLYTLDLLVKPDKKYVVYGYPSKKKQTRCISDIESLDYMQTRDFVPLTKGDEIMLRLIKIGNIAFCDNLTGTEICDILSRKGVL